MCRSSKGVSKSVAYLSLAVYLQSRTRVGKSEASSLYQQSHTTLLNLRSTTFVFPFQRMVTTSGLYFTLTIQNLTANSFAPAFHPSTTEFYPCQSGVTSPHCPSFEINGATNTRHTECCQCSSFRQHVKITTSSSLSEPLISVLLPQLFWTKPSTALQAL